MFWISRFNKITLNKLLSMIFIAVYAIAIGVTDADARSKNKQNQRNEGRNEYTREREDSQSDSGRNSQTSSDNKFIEEELKKYENAPFTEASGFKDDQVVGIRFKDDKTIFLSDEKTFYTQQSQKDEAFTNIDYFKKYPNLISIEFNKVDVTDEALLNMEKILFNMVNIVFDSCTLGEQGCKIISEIISRQTRLKGLTLQFTNIDSSKVRELMSTLDKLDKLTQLRISFLELDKDTDDKLASLFTKQKNKLKQLSITLGEVQKDSSFIKALSSLEGLTALHLSAVKMSGEDSNLLFKAIKNFKNLTDLSLTIDNMKEQEEVPLFDNVKDLSDSLSKLPELRNFSIDGMNFSSGEMQLIAKSIGNMKQLRSLNLSRNVCDKEVCTKLAESLKATELLQYLSMRGCSLDSPNFSEICRSLLALASLQVLCVGNNEIKDGIKSLTMKNMDNFQLLDIANNGITSDTFLSFVKEQLKDSKLRRIDVKDNEIYKKDDTKEAVAKKDEIEKERAKLDRVVEIYGL